LSPVSQDLQDARQPAQARQGRTLRARACQESEKSSNAAKHVYKKILQIIYLYFLRECDNYKGCGGNDVLDTLLVMPKTDFFCLCRY
jgi:hypothetical protein